MTKKQFITEILAPLTKAIDNEIDYLEYAINDFGNEYVIIWYHTHFLSGAPFRMQIKITANSLSQIAIETIKRIR